MNLQNPYSQYRQSQIETTPKLKLIVMLYDGAIRFAQQSVAPMKDGKHEQKGTCINRCIAIISHLTGTLDYIHGGDIAVNLCRIYEYLTRRLVEANCQNDPEIIDEVVLHLKELRSAWATVAVLTENSNQLVTTKPSGSMSDLSLAA
jgi:flagellar protein FliS